MKCMHICVAQTTSYFFTKLLIEPDFHCLADEIAEPRPDMNIKATAFTESKKFYYKSFADAACYHSTADGVPFQSHFRGHNSIENKSEKLILKELPIYYSRQHFEIVAFPC